MHVTQVLLGLYIFSVLDKAKICWIRLVVALVLLLNTFLPKFHFRRFFNS